MLLTLEECDTAIEACDRAIRYLRSEFATPSPGIDFFHVDAVPERRRKPHYALHLTHGRHPPGKYNDLLDEILGEVDYEQEGHTYYRDYEEHCPLILRDALVKYRNTLRAT